MPTLLAEKMQSRGFAIGANCQHDRAYLITDAADFDAAMNALLEDSALAPNEFTYTGLDEEDTNLWVFNKDDCRVNPILNADPPTMWHGTISYVLKDFSTAPYKTGDALATFAVGGSTVNRKVALSEVSRYAASGTAPDLKGAINVDAQGNVEGANVDTPTFKFTEVHYKAASEVTEEYVDALWGVAMAPVNSTPFRGFDAGEVRFIGVSGTRRSKTGDWELSFEFEASPNSTDAAPDSGITGIVKKGWHYLWFTFKQTDVTSGSIKYRIQLPEFAYVDKVYHESDFSALDLGADSLFPAGL